MVDSCTTAASTALVIREQGWGGVPTACSADCPALDLWSATANP